jgi:hypothetical protein
MVSNQESRSHRSGLLEESFRPASLAFTSANALQSGPQAPGFSSKERLTVRYLSCEPDSVRCIAAS